MVTLKDVIRDLSVECSKNDRAHLQAREALLHEPPYKVNVDDKEQLEQDLETIRNTSLLSLRDKHHLIEAIQTNTNNVRIGLEFFVERNRGMYFIVNGMWKVSGKSIASLTGSFTRRVNSIMKAKFNAVVGDENILCWTNAADAIEAREWLLSQLLMEKLSGE